MVTWVFLVLLIFTSIFCSTSTNCCSLPFITTIKSIHWQYLDRIFDTSLMNRSPMPGSKSPQQCYRLTISYNRAINCLMWLCNCKLTGDKIKRRTGMTTWWNNEFHHKVSKYPVNLTIYIWALFKVYVCQSGSLDTTFTSWPENFPGFHQYIIN